jgi:hypothetical protein
VVVGGGFIWAGKCICIFMRKPGPTLFIRLALNVGVHSFVLARCSSVYIFTATSHADCGQKQKLSEEYCMQF